MWLLRFLNANKYQWLIIGICCYACRVDSLLEVKVTAGRHRFYGLTVDSTHIHLKWSVTRLTNENPLLFVRLKSSLSLLTFALFTKHYTAPVMGFYIDEWTDYGKHKIPASSQSHRKQEANSISGQNAFKISLKQTLHGGLNCQESLI